MANAAYTKAQTAAAELAKQATVFAGILDTLAKTDLDRRSTTPADRKAFTSRARAKTQYKRALTRTDVLERRLSRHLNRISERLNAPLTRYTPARGRKPGSKNKAKGRGRKAAAAE